VKKRGPKARKEESMGLILEMQMEKQDFKPWTQSIGAKVVVIEIEGRVRERHGESMKSVKSDSNSRHEAEVKGIIRKLRIEGKSMYGDRFSVGQITEALKKE
jgi:hypothetical protein